MTAWPAPVFPQWYAVAVAAQVGPRPLALTVLGLPLVLARDGNGGWLALEDRCPHRQVPLSDGCMANGALHCAYHGWAFDAAGRLQAIPGMPDDGVLPAVRVRAYPVIEHDGLVWLRPHAEGPTTLSTLATELPTDSRRFLWHKRWPGHVLDVMENFLDPLHTHYLHPGLVRRGGARRPMQATLAVDEEGFQVDYQGQPEQSGLLYRLFESPRSRECARFAMPGSARLEYHYASGAMACITLHFTPVDARQTDVLATFHVQGRWAPAWAVRWGLWPFLDRVGRQDQAMLERQDWNQARFPGRNGASSSLDLVRAPLQAWWLHGQPPQAGDARQVTLML